MPPFPYQTRHHIQSLRDMARFAEALAGQLLPGDVVALDGPLGAGKTTFTRLLGEALGLQEPVTSPTFVLMHEYLSGRVPVVHVDLYRLGEDKADTLANEIYGIIDAGQALVLVEWACYGRFMDDCATITIQIAPLPDDENLEARDIRISSVRPLLTEGDMS